MTEAIEKPDPGYRYEFSLNELDAMSACLEAHGFAIIKGVLPDDVVAGLREAVWEGTDPERTLGPGESRTRHAWIESGPGAWSLLEHEPFMEVHRHLIGTDEMTVHRSAAIIRMPGSAPVRWHTDWQGFSEGPPKNSGEVLNRGLWPSGKWFYITGSRPVHGGLCVIEDSHAEGWEGPRSYSGQSTSELTAPRAAGKSRPRDPGHGRDPGACARGSRRCRSRCSRCRRPCARSDPCPCSRERRLPPPARWLWCPTSVR